jgi:hypothetical protein
MCNKKCAYFITVLLALSLVAGLSAAATSPSPKDGATDVLRDGTILTWSPGEGAAKFDVYFGSNLQYVTQVERAALYVKPVSGRRQIFIRHLSWERPTIGAWTKSTTRIRMR